MLLQKNSPLRSNGNIAAKSTVVSGKEGVDRDEARKEELRRNVREKWKRIRQLEDGTTSSPGSTSTLSEQESCPSKLQRDRISRRDKAVVEYDPTSPFEEEKGRQATKTQTDSQMQRQPRTQQMSQGRVLSNAEKGKSSTTDRPKQSVTLKAMRSAAKEVSRSQSASTAITTVNTTTNAVTIDQKIPLRPRRPLEAPRTYERKQGEVKSQRKESKTKEVADVHSEQQVEKPSARLTKARVCSAEEADADAAEEQGVAPSPVKNKKDEQEGVAERIHADSPGLSEEGSPSRRRERRSEVYQPALVPRSSSTEMMSSALAELEASLARLKAHGGSAAPASLSSPSGRRLPRRGKSNEESDEASESSKETGRAVRSLSPSKELRRLELEKRRIGQSSPPRVSFMQRLELAKLDTEQDNKQEGGVLDVARERITSAATLNGSKAARRRSMLEATSSYNVVSSDDAKTDVTASNKVASTGSREELKAKRRSMYSYVPTRKAEVGGVGNEHHRCAGKITEEYDSSCSIVIGDESVDDVLQRHQVHSSSPSASRQARDIRRRGEQLHFLQGLRVLVDVRDQDGEDASVGWVEKLRSVGAKVYTKVPSLSSTSSTSSSRTDNGSIDQKKISHVVYKNGKPSTLHFLRSLHSQCENGGADAAAAPAFTREQTPVIVVGVNWILQCLQQGKKVDERDFVVEIGKQAIFQNKRRTSMTPKQAPTTAFEGKEQHLSLAELLAKKKTIQRAPAQPSPLARRCWNLNASTSSSVSTATN